MQIGRIAQGLGGHNDQVWLELQHYGNHLIVWDIRPKVDNPDPAAPQEKIQQSNRQRVQFSVRAAQQNGLQPVGGRGHAD